MSQNDKDWRRLPSGIWVKPWLVQAGTPVESVAHRAFADFLARVVGPAVAVENALHERCTDRCLVREQQSRAGLN